MTKFLVISISFFLLNLIDFVINVQRFLRIMCATQGALMFASSLQIILGFTGGWRYVVRLVQLRIQILSLDAV